MSATFVIRDSAIHGRGAYSTQFISADTRIAEYEGERISFEEGNRRYRARQVDDKPVCEYTFCLDAETEIDGLSGGNDTAFINHGCEPNCVFVREPGRIFIHAKRDISEGAELLLDYKLRLLTPVPPEAMHIFACRCGAPTCRGTMLNLCVASREASEPAR